MGQVQADVCVVGAGYAGLSAAYKLRQAGRSVAVLEARDRVGGKVYTRVMDDGTVVNMGGTWLGDGHTCMHALAQEMGLETYRQHTAGDNLIAYEGKLRRYSGTVPRVNPLSLVDAEIAVKRLDAMAQTVPLDAPWKAEKAHEWDSTTIGAWIDSPLHMASAFARKLLGMLASELNFSDPSEVSLLHALFFIHSCKSIEWIGGTIGGAQQDHVVGGTQGIADAIAARLGDAVRLGSPVHRIAQTADGVTVTSDTAIVDARRVIVALPLILAGRLDYDPPLPPLRSQLTDRSPLGQGYKWNAVYPEPFWRNAGLSGWALNMDGVPEGCADCSPRDGKRGVLASFAFGPPARQLATVSADERRRLCLEGLAKWFGPQAANPTHFVEMDWAAEKYSRGAIVAHWAPGVLTNFGTALREPCGRIHWAGTETATQWHGSIEGAVRSGERAADEVLMATP